LGVFLGFYGKTVGSQMAEIGTNHRIDVNLSNEMMHGHITTHVKGGAIDEETSENSRAGIPQGGQKLQMSSSSSCICSILDLKVDKFVISSFPKENAPIRHDSGNVGGGGGGGSFKLRSGLPKIQLGTLGEIRTSAAIHDCIFCNLLVEAVETNGNSNRDDAAVLEHGNVLSEDMKIKLCWEIDGHQHQAHVGHSQNVSRRLLLSWEEGSNNNKSAREIYLVYVKPQDKTLPNSDAEAKFHAHDSYFGRLIEPTKGKQALIKSWLDTCDKDHHGKCKADIGNAAAFSRLVDETYFGVIDVIDMQLKRLPKEHGKPPEKFVALSYVWGHHEDTTKVYATFKSNTTLHLKHGGLEPELEKLPKAIRNAFTLVQRLGLRYLWVDRLCIVQDSIRSWRLNAAAMNQIYGQAYLTICAADGSDADTGLLAMESDEPSKQLTAVCPGGLQLLVSRTPEAVIQNSNWNTRGWTFQERLLSQRCLIFAEGKVYFQCRTTGFSEDIHIDINSSGWGLDRTNAPLQNFSQLRKKSIWFYMMSVRAYTKRKLTRRGDIIAAFDGVSNVMTATTMKAPFCFGLPTSHFDFALLWQAKGRLKRRIECIESRKEFMAEKDDFRGAEFPSWSWTGWESEEKEAFCDYDSGELDGCLLNVKEWLRNHTWIKWYIRDKDGNLRPLWDKNISLCDRSDEKRWRGYAGCKYRSSVIVIENKKRTDLNAPPSAGFDADYSDATQQMEEVYPMGASFEHERQRHQRIHHKESPNSKNKLLPESIIPHHTRHVNTNSSTPEPEGRIMHVRGPSPIYIAPNVNSFPSYASSSSSQGASSQVDMYGRHERPKLEDTPYNNFKEVISEYPFGNKSPLSDPSTIVELLDVPILQFFTWRKSLFVFIRDESELTRNLPAKDRRRYDIADSAGDWCGSITLESEYIHSTSERECQFIAISEAKAFTNDECAEWTYYVPKQPEESEWDLYFVFLIRWVKDKLIWERVGLGKVFKDAFAGATWDEIKLG